MSDTHVSSRPRCGWLGALTAATVAATPAAPAAPPDRQIALLELHAALVERLAAALREHPAQRAAFRDANR